MNERLRLFDFNGISDGLFEFVVVVMLLVRIVGLFWGDIVVVVFKLLYVGCVIVLL